MNVLSILLIGLNPDKAELAKPFHSTTGISAKIQFVIFLSIIGFGIYVGLRVWLVLRKEKKKFKRKNSFKK
ncbi:MAG: hypothetical protein ACWA6U_05145 [Breznakibacter sp.]